MLFNEKQKSEIEKGKSFGLLKEEIKLYAKPYFSAKQMQEIRIGLEEGQGMRAVKTYARFYLSHNEMAVRRQRIRERDFYCDEKLYKKKMILPALSVFTIFFSIFSIYAFYYSFFIHAPALNIEEEVISAKCGEIIDLKSYVHTTDDSNLKEINQYTSKLPGTYFIAYETGTSNKKKIKSMRIKVTDNRPPEIILKEEKIRISNIEDFNCNDYIDQVKDNVSTEKVQVGCSSELDASLEEQDILYTAVDKYGNTGYAKMTVKIVGNENESLS